MTARRERRRCSASCCQHADAPRIHLPLPLGQTGSVAFWDNRCVNHLAVRDAGRFRRIMRRVQIAGDKPV